MKHLKKALSVLLALTLCLGLTVPAFASTSVLMPHDENVTEDGKNWGNDWGGGPSLTVNGAISGRGGIVTDAGIKPFYKVAPNGGFTLNMPFPTAGRQYTVDVTGIYMHNQKSVWKDFTGSATYQQGDGKSIYHFACAADMAGDDKAILVSISWADGSAHGGSAAFCMEVVNTPSFADVPMEAYYAKAVDWAVKENITTGTSFSTFSPSSPCTTAQILALLWRNAGRPGAAGGNMAWKDELNVVTNWARTKGIAVPSNLNTTCTRIAAVTYMWKAAGSPAPQRGASFTDVDPSSEAGRAVSWAVEKGITEGASPTAFSPNNGCNRAQIVTLLYRQMVEPLTPSAPVTPPSLTAGDVPPTPPVNENGSITITGVMLLRTSVPDLPVSTGGKTYSSLTQLAVGEDWMRAHGRNYTVSWSVDNPGSVRLTETEVNSFKAVQITSGSTPGNAIITCTVTGEDGHRDQAYCYVTVTGYGAATPTTPSADMTAEQMCARVVELVNQERAKEGLSPLATKTSLTAAAAIRAPELVTKFSHDRPDGTQCFTALREAGVTGYRTSGENIASGQRSPEEVVNDWMNSPGHRANILNASFTHIGVGYYNNCWVQLFIG